ncbi:hypothetical protein PF005_g26674 [Phytophthora fragariae]|uniref:Uncharacterized protein n=1 Tax=Phytophthora fragariae TaxID=53985 RepID=A0A6A3DTD9_9STRA|nr:hypothetical protein PF003_g38402 [Phytophthora fragariae]KAE8922491.1 hypothetical protein PF009_g27246 [Phytophthora fragariae]KAE9069859.1 hypothetical protein PF010_g26508 [Phytophthora fragariae]KAE9071583.1 hypothetical protein PF007_g26498 [Phytophthora fragariae]KAE9087129.1 hypothetical protein PF006_g25873 [Phytophthora fragariae]
MELPEMTKVFEEDSQEKEQEELQELPLDEDLAAATTRGRQRSASLLSVSLCPPPMVRFGIIVAAVLDFANCIFSNIRLSMTDSELYQVVYSPVICWSALVPPLISETIVPKE